MRFVLNDMIYLVAYVSTAKIEAVAAMANTRATFRGHADSCSNPATPLTLMP